MEERMEEGVEEYTSSRSSGKPRSGQAGRTGVQAKWGCSVSGEEVLEVSSDKPLN